MEQFEYIQLKKENGNAIIFQDNVVTILEYTSPSGNVTRSYVYPDRVLVAVERDGEEGFVITSRYMLCQCVEDQGRILVFKQGWGSTI